MVYVDLLIGIRRRLDDMNSRSFSVGDISFALDEGAKFLQGEIGLLRNRTSLAVVANQRQYTLAASVQEPLVLEYFDSSGGKEIVSQTEEQFRNYSRVVRRATIPQSYTFLETEGVILLNPIPDTAAGTTTINIAGGVNSSTATITVASTTNFPTEGRLIIETEVLRYTNTTATTFTGAVRGIEGTTAAAHANSTTVTERDLVVWGKQLWLDRQMRTYYTTGTAAATNASKTVTGTSTSWTNDIAPGDYFGTTANVTTTAPTKWYKIDTVDSDTQVTLVDNFGEDNYSTSTYIMSSPNPFPNYCDPVLTAYAVSSLLKKTGPAGQAQAGREWATVERFLASARKNNLKIDTVLYPRPLVSRRRTQRMGVTAGEYQIG